MPATSLVGDLLRSPDEAKVVLEVTLVTASEMSQDLQNRRVLAVISHKDDWDLTEEGRYVFLLPTFNFAAITKLYNKSLRVQVQESCQWPTGPTRNSTSISYLWGILCRH